MKLLTDKEAKKVLEDFCKNNTTSYTRDKDGTYSFTVTFSCHLDEIIDGKRQLTQEAMQIGLEWVKGHIYGGLHWSWAMDVRKESTKKKIQELLKEL